MSACQQLLVWHVLQIVMSANKEAVISEKELSCRFGQEVLVAYAEPIRSSEYDSFDAFVDAVQREWDIQWKRIYSAEFSSVHTSLKETPQSYFSFALIGLADVPTVIAFSP